MGHSIALCVSRIKEEGGGEVETCVLALKASTWRWRMKLAFTGQHLKQVTWPHLTSKWAENYNPIIG